MIVEETIKPALELFEKIKPKDKVAVIHGHDNDSVCSAAIIQKLLLNFYKTEPKLIVSGLNSSVTEDVLEAVRRYKPDYVIIVDISDVNVSILTELRNISRVMIIDHHVPKGYVKITYVNPRIFDKELYIPSSYICYKIYERFSNVKEILWIAGIGTLSDMGLRNCNDLFGKIKLEEGELVGKNENIDDVLLENSLLGKLVKIFDSARIVNGIGGSLTVLDVLLRVKDYHEVLKWKHKAEQLMKWYEIAEKEFGRLLKEFEKKRKQIKNIMIYKIKSKYNMKSPLSTYLVRKMNTEVLVVYQKSGRYIDASFRRGRVSIVDLDQLANNSVRNIPNSNGGGHQIAAGCRFPARYLNKFLGNLKKIA